eukprot:CAMPEP_0180570996 /NCGR_PEP_ID=MMETSP1037_2-20121125/8487_1 /TAXON_ID=632150 /ORGANISM="Azadinium spinosum, Strain 3D9" /LENGTH=88 /DNA_ID=CAMNT_0022588291 /DNA_START=151 /DNA_END=417 /DNA_ORIENTATION=+
MGERKLMRHPVNARTYNVTLRWESAQGLPYYRPARIPGQVNIEDRDENIVLAQFDFDGAELGLTLHLGKRCHDLESTAQRTWLAERAR